MSVVDVRALAVVPAAHEQRIVDAALRCMARWGVAKTSLEDVAREAGCSRATVYRTFPGGKDALIEAVARTELARFVGRLEATLSGAGDDLEHLLVLGVGEVGRAVGEHQPLQFLLAHEPEVILPRLAFGAFDEVLGAAARFFAPYLVPHLGPDAERGAEWLVRITASYLFNPAPDVDLTDPESVRRVVRDFVLPALAVTART